MKKIALHIDNNDKLILLEYKDVDESKKKSFLSGIECFKYLNELSKSKIVDIYENPNGKDITLEYSKYVIELNDYRKILRKKGMSSILNNIRVYNEKTEVSSHKHKKVTRKNKYTNARIIAGGLSLLVISGCVLGMMHKSNKGETADFVAPFSDDLEEDFISTNKINIDDVVINEQKLVLKSETVNMLYDSTPKTLIDYNDRSNTKKAHLTKSYYGQMIEKYAKTYGIDVSLAIAVATQERGIHATTMDAGGATGLMQVQNAVWKGEKLSAYNFNTKKMETITVDEKSLSNIDYNIRVGCMILQTNLKYMNYNTLAALQSYNMGYGSMQRILNAYSIQCGKSVESILKDPTDTGWMDYRYLVKYGDQKYVENVLSWIGNDINISNKKDNGIEVCFKINTFEESKIMH